MEFYGHVFSGQGVQPSPQKIDSVIHMGAPQNASEVRSLLGMANYCGQRFIKDYATMTHDLRELTRADVPWSWDAKHQHAWDKLRQALASTTALQYFDPMKESEVYVDASPVGISAILMQKPKDSEQRCNIHFASRALTPTEQRYSQIEREALAVVWACEHLNVYLYGSSFRVFTDHKPLLALLKNAKSKPSARIQGWALRLQPYCFELVFRPGKENPADYLSRHTHTEESRQKSSSREQRLAERIVCYVATNAAPKPLPIEKIKEATLDDPTLQAVMSALKDGKWYRHGNTPDVDQTVYKACRLIQTELSAAPDHDILLKGTRIMIPASLHKSVVELAHTGHQGMVRTKALLREKVWFRGIDTMVEEVVKNCLMCQVATPTPQSEPLKVSTLPAAPWAELSLDFGQLPNGQYLMVLIDDYSRFPFVKVINSTAASTVIPELDDIMAIRGIPHVIRTDNGPPFNSEDFRRYAARTGFRHRKVTPLWPRANGEVERFMGTVKKAVKAAIALHMDWRKELRDFLLSYRATPHTTTKAAPATLLFGSAIRTKLPEILQPLDDSTVRSQDTFAKLKMKREHDKKPHVKPSSIGTGDLVLIKDTSLKKGTPFSTKPLTVVQRKGTMITADRGDKTITRNVSFFKRAPPDAELDSESSDDEEPEEAIEAPHDNTINTGAKSSVASTPPATPDMPAASASPRTGTRPRRDRKTPTKFKDFVM